MKDKKVEQETVPSKTHNYILLTVVFVVFVAFVLYLCQVYKVGQEEKMRIPVISGALQEIYQEDLEHYILDNPTALIYMCTANDDTCRSFESSKSSCDGC